MVEKEPVTFYGYALTSGISIQGELAIRAGMIRFGTIDGIVLPFRHSETGIAVEWRPSGYGGRTGSINFSNGISRDQEERAKFLINYLAEHWKLAYLKPQKKLSKLGEIELSSVRFSDTLAERVRDGDFYRFRVDCKVSPAVLGFGGSRTAYEVGGKGHNSWSVVPERYR